MGRAATAPGQMHGEGHHHTHGHDGAHGHDGGGQSHRPAAENHAARRHPEQVVLDIGGEIGALILHTDAEMVGVEVEISATGEDGIRTHKDVLEREINGRPAYTAVFDQLAEGTYTLWVNDEARAREVVVLGACVAELDWAEKRAAVERP